MTAPDLVQAALLDFAVTAVHEHANDAWRVFFDTPAGRDRASAALATAFPELELASVDVPDEDWAARSQAGLQAVRIGDVTVAPPWDVPPPVAGTLTVVIRPSMGFGTGHHATTRLCLAALQHADPRGLTVLDVGTGSGVLAIAASLLGAAAVVGIDDDADAIASAREGREANGVARLRLETWDLRSTELDAADLVMANLTGGLLVSAAGHLRRLTEPGGRLILSGFMAVEEAAVRAAFPDCDAEHRGAEDEWICVTLRRSPTPGGDR
jgi:ribosomal protein L11 methyltransferase